MTCVRSEYRTEFSGLTSIAQKFDNAMTQSSRGSITVRPIGIIGRAG